MNTDPTKTTSTNAQVNASPTVLVFEAADGKKFYLHKERIVLGSVITADVRLSGEGVSPLHAVVEYAKDSSVTLYDLASETGTFVNQQKIVTRQLKVGDVITIGRITLKFTTESLAQTQKKTVIEKAGSQSLIQNPGEDLKPLLLESERDVEAIFDYRPSDKPAIEIVMSWRNTILDIEHFVSETEVTLGSTRDCHFGVPTALESSRWVWITREKHSEAGLLMLDPKMTGVFQREGRLVTIEELRNGAFGPLQGGALQLTKSDFAKIRLGEVDFYLSFTQAPPRLKNQRILDRDPFFLRIFLTSMALTGITVTGLLQMKVPQNLEAEQLPDRIATILYQPEKFSSIKKVEKEKQDISTVQVPTPKEAKPVTKVDIKPTATASLKPIPKEMNVGATAANSNATTHSKGGGSKGQKEAKEGAGARAKGKEGKRGTTNGAKFAESQNKAKRPSPEGGTGPGGAKSQVNDEGNVDFLKGVGSKIQNILSGSAEKLGKSGEKLQGFGGFDSRGNGGLALTGTGKGGGGDADSLGGLSDHGKGGGRVGTGMGAAGNGSGLAGGKTRVAIRQGGPEETIVMGAIDQDAIEAALLAHKDEFRLCYEREINAENPNIAGRVSTHFVIGSSGHVTQAGIASSTLGNANAERCIVTVIKRIDFPMPRGGGTVQVTYPFKFSSMGSK